MTAKRDLNPQFRPARRQRRSTRALRILLAGCAVLGASAIVCGGEVFLETPSPQEPLPVPTEQRVAPHDLLGEIEDLESDKSRRLQELQTQLRQLQQVLQQRRQTEAESQPAAPEPAVPSTPPPEAPAPLPSAQSSSPPMPAAPAELFPQPIVEGPIDRLSLADSLFATKDAELALQMYEQIEPESVAPEDQQWITYQIAGCYRRLGNFAEAEQRYRRLAGMTDGGWYASQSRWWLDAITTRKSLEADLQRVTNTIQTMEQQIHAATAR